MNQIVVGMGEAFGIACPKERKSAVLRQTLPIMYHNSVLTAV
jgi:hypothetical protein